LRKNIFETEAKGGTRRLSAGINASGMKTWQKLDQVKVEKETKKYVRVDFNTDNDELEGSAPLLANANATYHRIWTEKEISYTASVVYGYTSERLYLIGSSTHGNQYDESFNELNVILKANIKKVGLSLSGKNLMNFDIVRVQKNIEQQHIVSSYSKGIQLSLGFSYKF
jgi:hypothetical protein